MKLYHGSNVVVSSPDVDHSREKYDLIRGGVANDKVFDTCELYFRGLISKETAIERLRFTEPNLQLCWKNNRVIRNNLFFSESIAL